jgi:hypothetical protein
LSCLYKKKPVRGVGAILFMTTPKLPPGNANEKIVLDALNKPRHLNCHLNDQFEYTMPPLTNSKAVAS